MATSTNRNPLIFAARFYLFISPAILLIVLLAMDIMTIPFLTPFVHLTWSLLRPILVPLTPFVGPLLSMCIVHCWRHPKVKNDVGMKLLMGGSIGQYFTTSFMTVVRTVWWSLRGEVGFTEAWKAWVECAFLVVLVGVEWMGLRWEGGLIDEWIEKCLEKYGGVFGEKEGMLEDREGKTTRADVGSKS